MSSHRPRSRLFWIFVRVCLGTSSILGKYFIQLCGTTPCMVCGSEDIKKTIMKALDVEDGGTTKDGLFSLLEVECLGACANAPMVQVLLGPFCFCCHRFLFFLLLLSLVTASPPSFSSFYFFFSSALLHLPLILFHQLNDDYYECLTPATTLELLAACKAGTPPPMGKWGSLPMNGQVKSRAQGSIPAHKELTHTRQAGSLCADAPRREKAHLFLCVTYRLRLVKVSCEGPQGKTSLASVPVPTMRTDLLKGEVDPASVKKHMHY
jgi:NADH dehydrogenase (ubiquinone) flavoprotein 2